MIGRVYVIKGGDLFKIGSTCGDAKARLNALKGGSPLPLEVVCELPMAHYRQLESFTHRHFHHKRATEVGGREWFRLDQDDLKWLRERAVREFYMCRPLGSVSLIEETNSPDFDYENALTTAEAAQQIGIGQRTVQKRILRLGLKVQTAGPVTLLTTSQVERIRNESGTPGPKPNGNGNKKAAKR